MLDINFISENKELIKKTAKSAKDAKDFDKCFNSLRVLCV